ncbi:hypothetical protein HMI54_012839 [Coelomomyces lativittatus]|nr:hypothetical protein HMI54_012839 [Coelomomyces lativittatus]KAJ1501635.1 hypothetical protein HMI55_003295 [Coelomomyces lativittatus]KAJ1505451.1 hypothetical protein HMI56_001124 [Coelomomyces lativittatus]
MTSSSSHSAWLNTVRHSKSTAYFSPIPMPSPVTTQLVLKRKRGRPRKSETHSTNSPVYLASSASMSSSNGPSTTSSSTMNPTAMIPMVPKRLGRPPKFPRPVLSPTSSTTPTSNTSTPLLVKRGRGRPRKYNPLIQDTMVPPSISKTFPTDPLSASMVNTALTSMAVGTTETTTSTTTVTTTTSSSITPPLPPPSSTLEPAVIPSA